MTINFVWCHFLSIFDPAKHWRICDRSDLTQLLREKDKENRQEYLALRSELRKALPEDLANVVCSYEHGDGYEWLCQQHIMDNLSQLHFSYNLKYVIGIVPFVLGYIELFSWLAFFSIRCMDMFEYDVSTIVPSVIQQYMYNYPRRKILTYVIGIWLFAMTIHLCGIVFYYLYCRYVHQHNIAMLLDTLSQKLEATKSRNKSVLQMFQHLGKRQNVFLYPFVTFQMWCNLYPLECVIPEWRHSHSYFRLFYGHARTLVNSSHVVIFLLFKYIFAWLLLLQFWLSLVFNSSSSSASISNTDSVSMPFWQMLVTDDIVHTIVANLAFIGFMYLLLGTYIGVSFNRTPNFFCIAIVSGIFLAMITLTHQAYLWDSLGDFSGKLFAGNLFSWRGNTSETENQYSWTTLLTSGLNRIGTILDPLGFIFILYDIAICYACFAYMEYRRRKLEIVLFSLAGVLTPLAILALEYDNAHYQNLFSERLGLFGVFIWKYLIPGRYFGIALTIAIVSCLYGLMQCVLHQVVVGSTLIRYTYHRHSSFFMAYPFEAQIVCRCLELWMGPFVWYFFAMFTKFLKRSKRL
ncbi:hypothetical protein RFI_07622 [Reticulomyxa filosa]|uniref:Uncharacterized protein n=1 Tax=Reticulomyxa filosa TaxID=46433 RepID=X6NU28_RETFI|nr:hypothetical protein RFI_07622 [Reticulomyxa filosa]|eukprot:ETO29501.1 hypothetical protein RFI_07622 [Reticulomyxa filosa]